MDSLSRQVELMTFLINHQIDFPETARISLLARKIGTHFPNIAATVNPEGRPWRHHEANALADFISKMDTKDCRIPAVLPVKKEKLKGEKLASKTKRRSCLRRIYFSLFGVSPFGIQGTVACSQIIASLGCPVSDTKDEDAIGRLVSWVSKNNPSLLASNPKYPVRARRGKQKAQRQASPSPSTKADFYRSWDWRTLRMEVIREFGRRCQCCGSTPDSLDVAGSPVKIVVDHIKPISKFWNLRLDKKNLQILCDECNQGKGNWDQTDYRPASVNS